MPFLFLCIPMSIYGLDHWHFSGAVHSWFAILIMTTKYPLFPFVHVQWQYDLARVYVRLDWGYVSIATTHGLN